MSSSRDRYGQIRSFTAREPVRTATLSNSFATRITRVGPRHTVREPAWSEATCTSSTTSTSCSATTSRQRSRRAPSCASPPRRSRSSRSRRCARSWSRSASWSSSSPRPSFVTDKVTDKLPQGAPRVLHPARPQRESSLYGSEFEIRLRNKLTQRAIARECADWMRRKVHVPVEHDRRPDAAVRGRRRQRPAYMPLHGFTAADLGYERGNAVSNIVTKHRRGPDDGAVPPALRPDLAQPRPARGRHRGGLRAHRQRVRGELAGAHLLPDPVQPVLRVPRRHQRGRAAQRPAPATRTRSLEEPLQLPARRRDRHHQQAGDLQRLHPRRQRRPGEDVHRAGGHQVLRAAQQVRARARAEEARGQLDELQREPHDQHLRAATGSTTTCLATPTCRARGASRSACRSTG